MRLQQPGLPYTGRIRCAASRTALARYCSFPWHLASYGCLCHQAHRHIMHVSCSHARCRLCWAHTGVDYGSRNVLADPDLRSGIKDFSSWPTVPQARPPPAPGQSLEASACNNTQATHPACLTSAGPCLAVCACK